MKRLILTFLGTLTLTVLLQAQSFQGRIEAENRQVLTESAARPTVVATKRVPRGEFHLWYGHLTGGSWASDENWYPDETQRLYFSRINEAGDRDVCWSVLEEGGVWRVPGTVNADAVSSGDECFPMLSPDGKRLYFCSDGLFGMGGYDIYVATWDPDRKTWGKVRNMGVPFNSKGDDLLFCDTPDGRYSVFASNRDCDPDSVVIYVLKQEVPVFSKVSSEEAERLSHLAVTAPDGGYPFRKLTPGRIPSMPFETPVEKTDESFRVGTEGSFATVNRLPSGLVYQIQMFVSSGKPTIRQLKGVSPVYVHKQRSGKMLSAAGLFRTYAEAEQALSQVKRVFPTAFVIAFEDGSPLSLSKARKKESSVKVITEEVHIVK